MQKVRAVFNIKLFLASALHTGCAGCWAIDLLQMSHFPGTDAPKSEGTQALEASCLDRVKRRLLAIPTKALPLRTNARKHKVADIALTAERDDPTTASVLLYLEDTRQNFRTVSDAQIEAVKQYAAALAKVDAAKKKLMMTTGGDFLYCTDENNKLHIFINTRHNVPGKLHARIVKGEMECHFADSAPWDVVELGY